MPDTFFLSAPGPVQGERVLWTGHCAVAEYAFHEPASLPRWTLPEDTEVIVTETRVAYADPHGGGGELHWPWPQHLRVQPGNRDTGRSATVTQIQLVCGGPDGTFPALVFAGGDLTAVADADRLANVLRQAIARFRVEHTAALGLTVPQSRMLSRLAIGPEFSNYLGGEGQTISLLGAVPVERPAVEPFPEYSPDPYAGQPSTHRVGPYPPRMLPPAPTHPYPAGVPEPYQAGASTSHLAGIPEPYPTGTSTPHLAGIAEPYPTGVAEPYPAAGLTESYPAARDTESYPVTGVAESYPAAGVAEPPAGFAEPYPGAYADPYAPIAAQPQRLEAAPPDLASRAAELAARVASLVSSGAVGLGPGLDRHETRTTNLSAFLGSAGTEYPSADQSPGLYRHGGGYALPEGDGYSSDAGYGPGYGSASDPDTGYGTAYDSADNPDGYATGYASADNPDGYATGYASAGDPEGRYVTGYSSTGNPDDGYVTGYGSAAGPDDDHGSGYASTGGPDHGYGPAHGDGYLSTNGHGSGYGSTGGHGDGYGPAYGTDDYEQGGGYGPAGAHGSSTVQGSGGAHSPAGPEGFGDGYGSGVGRGTEGGVDRAEAIRRTAARFAGNAARIRNATPRQTQDGLGTSPRRGHHNA